MTELPEGISPCSNVRRTCYSLMMDPCFHDDNSEESNGGKRSVVINESALDRLGDKIAKSIIAQQHSEENKVAAQQIQASLRPRLILAFKI
jgi:hypothetical protein